MTWLGFSFNLPLFILFPFDQWDLHRLSIYVASEFCYSSFIEMLLYISNLFSCVIGCYFADTETFVVSEYYELLRIYGYLLVIS